jgi:hypothetical protein
MTVVVRPGIEVAAECVRRNGAWQVTVGVDPPLRLTVEHLEDIPRRVRAELRTRPDDETWDGQLLLVCRGEPYDR